MNEVIIHDLMEQEGVQIKGLVDKLAARAVPLGDVFLQIDVKGDEFAAVAHGRAAALAYLETQGVDVATDPYALALREPSPPGAVLAIFADETGFVGVHLGETDPIVGGPANPRTAS